MPEDPDHSNALADDLFGGSSDPAATGPIRRVSDDSPLRPAAAQSRSPRWWSGRGAKVGVSAVLVLALAGIWAGSEPDVIAGRASPGDSAGPVAPAGPSVPGDPAAAARAVPGGDLTERATRTDTDCAAHSYGQVQKFLTDHPCRSVRRALFTGTDAGQPVVVAVSTVQMGSESDAAQLQQLADVSGTGNISDLLREGVSFAGAPSKLRDASYASQLRGPVLVIAEAATISGAARPLDPLAAAALALGG